MTKKITAKNTLKDEDIIKLANTKAVTIILDIEGTSEEAKMGCKFAYNRKSKELTVVATLLQDKKKELLLTIIRKVFSSGGIILKQSKEDTLESYIDYTKTNNSDKSILKFFEGVIPKNDYYALKMSLYLRDQQKKGRVINQYKENIRERFGERGANIANLCSAGYFEGEFLPLLYNSVPKESFQEYYEIVIEKKARALFVHRDMGLEDLEKEFNLMLEKALKYHITEFRIHGLGTQNVATIKEFFLNKAADPENRYIIKKFYESEKEFIIVYTVTLISD